MARYTLRQLEIFIAVQSTEACPLQQTPCLFRSRRSLEQSTPWSMLLERN